MPCMRRLAVVPALALMSLATLTAGCAKSSTAAGASTPPATTPAASASSSPAPDPCAPAQLQTLTPGTLTIATSKPAYPPYIIDDTPTSGKGYESAVAYAVATKLGYAQTAVTWVNA